MTARRSDAIDPRALRAGDRRALAKAITLVESTAPGLQVAAQDLLEALPSDSSASLRIGISGAPGVGKSTFIEAFGQQVLADERRLAVLAVDPSSPLAGGSILGDKTRMERLSRQPGAFIRPSPSGGMLGGVAQKTRETMMLCEAAGFDTIIVETVGVGQSEFEVASMVDFFLVLTQPNAGDELQGLKKGILELAHAVVVNKADGPAKNQADVARAQLQGALGLPHQPAGWITRVLTCSALEGTGIREFWSLVRCFLSQARSDGSYESRRASQRREWMDKLVGTLLQQKLMACGERRRAREQLEQAVQAGEITPLTAARRLVGML